MHGWQPYPLLRGVPVIRFFATLVVAVSTVTCCFAEPVTWSCKPVWSFSGMGKKVYEGLSADEPGARNSARASCVNQNRGLELDDFCLAAPIDNDWHCAQGLAGASQKS